MDDFAIHVPPVARRFTHIPPVLGIGYIRKKTNSLKHTFGICAFSFIFEGSGFYRYKETAWAIHAPCVFTQWPGAYLEYGPDNSWEELYFTYQPDLYPLLRQRGYLNENHPVWNVDPKLSLRQNISRLFSMADRIEHAGVVDQIDHLCESMILKSLLSETQLQEDSRTLALREIRIEVERNCMIDHDFEKLAQSKGMSPRTFRRLWAEEVGIPPTRYVMQLRIHQACRLLAETHLPINEIALNVGFVDPLYFSRKFRQLVGKTARDYRNIYSAHLRESS